MTKSSQRLKDTIRYTIETYCNTSLKVAPLMIEGLVVLTQVSLLVLVVVLVRRMLMLTRSEPLLAVTADNQFVPVVPKEKPSAPKPKREASSDRTELFTHLHILAGLQERDCRISGLQLSEAPEMVRAYAAAWLYGAACALCHQTERHSDALAGMVAQITTRKTGIRQSEAVQAIATLTSCSVLLACFRAGLEGAEFWQENQYVQPENSLYSAITANALI